ncbi:hypothetical protein WA158_000759 [Blastocystis sp. Blastoise]
MAYDIEISKKTYTLLTLQIFFVQIISGIFDNFRGLATSSLKSEFQFSDNIIAYIISGLGYCYVAYGFLVTWCIQKFSYKISILLGLSVWFIGIISMFFSYTEIAVIASLLVIWLGTCYIQMGNNGLSNAIFVKNSTLMISMMHFVFGIGTFLSPLISRSIIPHSEYGFRAAYIVLSIPIIIAYIYIIIIKYDFKRKQINNDEKPPLLMSQILKKPHLWLFTITFSFMSAIMYVTVDWSMIYLETMYGWKNTEQGSTFMSIYTFGYAISRLILAFLGNKINIFIAYYCCLGVNLLIYIIGFSLGESGSYILALSGFTIGPYWPLMICINMKFWEENSPIASNLMLSLQGILKELLNLLVGYINEWIGPAYGYKLLIVYCILEIFGTLWIQTEYKKKEKEREGKISLNNNKDKKENIELHKIEGNEIIDIDMNKNKKDILNNEHSILSHSNSTISSVPPH